MQHSLGQCPLFCVSSSVAGFAMESPSLSQESRFAAHAALEKDADLESLITNISTQTEASDCGLLRDFLSSWSQLIRIRQNSARHAAKGSTVRYRCMPWTELYELK